MNHFSNNNLEIYEDEFIKMLGSIPKGTTDIVINPNHSIYFYEKDGNQYNKKISFDKIFLNRIATIFASFSGNDLNENSPSLSLTLPKSKYRLEILIPPIVEEVSISIRIPNLFFYSLENLISSEMLTLEQSKILTQFVKDKKNIIISGQTGSGKTTLLNAMANTISKDERIIVIEDDVNEINIEHDNIVYIKASKNIFSGRQAVKSALRMNPDRIIYGETRDGQSALEILKALRTGHAGGIFTLHSSGGEMAKDRLGDLLNECNIHDTKKLIDSTIDCILHLDFDKNGKRKLMEITGC